jgi:hypothetical protein
MEFFNKMKLEIHSFKEEVDSTIIKVGEENHFVSGKYKM